jgi:hypothetical protein
MQTKRTKSVAVQNGGTISDPFLTEKRKCLEKGLV